MSEAPKRRIRAERLVTIPVDADMQSKLSLARERLKAKKALFISELKSRLGLIMGTCDALSIPYSRVRDWAKNDPEFAEALVSVKEYTLDAVENELFKKITGGDTKAIIFYLQTKGRSRGFGNKLEVTGEDGGPIQTESSIRVADLAKELPADVLNTIVNAAIISNASQEVIEAEFIEEPAIAELLPELTDEDREEFFNNIDEETFETA